MQVLANQAKSYNLGISGRWVGRLWIVVPFISQKQCFPKLIVYFVKLYLKVLWILISSENSFPIKKLLLVGFKGKVWQSLICFICKTTAFFSFSFSFFLFFFFFFFKDSLLFTPKSFLQILLQIKIAFPSGSYMEVGILDLGLSI